MQFIKDINNYKKNNKNKNKILNNGLLYFQMDKIILVN